MALATAVRAARLFAWASLLFGLAAIAYAGLQGDLEVYLLLVVPVVAGSGPWAALGMLAVMVGLAGLVWTKATDIVGSQRPPGPEPTGPDRPPSSPEREPERETKGGGVILLGPIPIAWGSDRSTLVWVVVVGIALTVAAIALTWWVRP